jgi:hypothetical protein
MLGGEEPAQELMLSGQLLQQQWVVTVAAGTVSLLMLK